eukprot:jgi/Chrzof1/6496/Cz18g13140.t1
MPPAASLDEDDPEVVDEEQPLAKRTKTSLFYPRGTVKTVKVQNFMTFGDTVLVSPGPRLNLVLGPNGTGKSSLVCALCVGLGGSTKLLGRADNIKDFIKRGHSEGWIEITLSAGADRRDYIIRRDMRLTDGRGHQSSQWQINNQEKTQKQVRALVASLNIQFDNLCQFLPQDKVVEFACMDPYELLIATEKAIGDASLFHKHEQLIHHRMKVKEGVMTYDALKKQYNKLVDENQKLERDYERFRRREELLVTVQVLKNKLVWVTVHERQDELRKAKQFLQQAKDVYRSKKEQSENDEAPLRVLCEKAKAAKAEHDHIMHSTRSIQGQCNQANQALEEQERAIADLQTKTQGLEQRSAQQKANLEKAKASLQKLQAEVDALPPVENHAAELAAIDQQMRELEDLRNDMYSEQEHLQMQKNNHQLQAQKLQGDIHQCDNLKFQRLKALSGGARSAWEWVESQKRAGAFKGEVYGPIALDINMKLPQYAVFVEMALGNLLHHWVVQTCEDEALLSGEFKSKEYYPAVHCCPYDVNQPIEHPLGEPARFAQFGIGHTLDAVFDAPPLVKQAVTDVCSLNRTYIMEQHDTNIIKYLLDNTPIHSLYTPERYIERIDSQWGGKAAATDQTQEINTRLTVLGGQSGANADAEKERLVVQLITLQATLAELDAALHTKAQQRSELDSKLQVLDGQRRVITDPQQQQVQRRNRVLRNCNDAKRQVQQLSAQPDPLAQKPQLQAKLKEAATNHFKALTDLCRLTAEQWHVMKATVAGELKHRELNMQARAMATASEELRHDLQTAQQKVNQCQVLVNRYTAQLREAKQNAEHTCPLTDVLKGQFTRLPETRGEINEQVHRLEDEAAEIVCNNPRVMEEYKERQAAIGEVEEKLKAAEEELSAGNAEIEAIKVSKSKLSKMVKECSNFLDSECCFE